MSNKLDKALIIHCHTSGINWDGPDVSTNNQPLSIALGVVDLTTLKMIDTVYVKIKFDDTKYSWDNKLVSIHGLTLDELEDGESFADATAILAEFIYNHFGVEKSIMLFGYSPLSFHIPFLNKLFKAEDIEFKFDNRVIDLFSLMATLGHFTVKETFEFFGVDDGPHSSLFNIKTYLKIFKTFKQILQSSLESE